MQTKLNTMNTRAFFASALCTHFSGVFNTSEGLFAPAAVEQNIKLLGTLRETI